MGTDKISNAVETPLTHYWCKEGLLTSGHGLHSAKENDYVRTYELTLK